MSNSDKQSDANRLDRISQNADAASRIYNQNYSRFIRWARLILPVFAVAIIAVVMTWDNTTQDIKAIKQETSAPTIGKNELLNPRFESKDQKDQPYTITAKRAVQGETNDNLIILEEPLADMLLKSGAWLAAKAKQGAYRQDTNRLLLTGDVQLFHDAGYQMNTEELNVNMETNDAWSEVDVYGQGPRGEIEAKGVDASSSKQTLKFIGPAKLTIKNSQALQGAFGG